MAIDQVEASSYPEAVHFFYVSVSFERGAALSISAWLDVDRETWDTCIRHVSAFLT